MSDSITDPTTDHLTEIAHLVEEVRASSPLVHCLTNTVVANLTANVLLAAGAAPAMVDAPEESGVLAGVSGAVLVNLGTITRAQAEGVDAAVTPDEVADAATEVARRYGAVVAVSGAVDLVTDGTRTLRVDSGTPLLTRVTGVGCSLGALMAAFRAVTDDGVLAATAATALVTVAGEQAAAASSGPGSFAVAWLDRLAGVEAGAVAAGAGLR